MSMCTLALTSHQGVCLLYHQASNANGPTTGTTLSAPLAALSMGAIAYTADGNVDLHF